MVLTLTELEQTQQPETSMMIAKASAHAISYKQKRYETPTTRRHSPHQQPSSASGALPIYDEVELTVRGFENKLDGARLLLLSSLGLGLKLGLCPLVRSGLD